MVIRPLSGYIPERESKLGHPMKPSMDPQKLAGNMHTCIDLILDDLKNTPQPATAHTVLNSINQQWKSIGLLFDWY